MESVEATSEWPTVLRSDDLAAKIRAAKVLCIGAGGIGCELLKTLVCTGFQNIELVRGDADVDSPWALPCSVHRLPSIHICINYLCHQSDNN